MIRIIRWKIDVPWNDRSVIIRSRDNVKNLIDAALVRHGYTIQPNYPARYGFGVIGKRIQRHGENGPRLYHVDRIIVGSSDPNISHALRQWTVDDLWEPNAVPGAGLDLRIARLYEDPNPIGGEAIALYTVSPIRVIAPQGSQTILELGEAWEQAINRTMTRRFQQPFHLRIIPDSWYVRSRRGHIVARMAVKVRSDGYVVAYPGLVLPLILAGPPEELAIAWYSGLGGSTAMGYGCMEVVAQ